MRWADFLEFGVPVWNCSLTKDDSCEIERVQKSFLHIVLEKSYLNYDEALEKFQMETLEKRRKQICEKFAIKASKHPKHQTWFKKNNDPVGTRSDKTNYMKPLARLQRYKDSPIPYLTKLLNNM